MSYKILFIILTLKISAAFSITYVNIYEKNFYWLTSTIERNYAPLKYKQELHQFSWAQTKAEYLAKARAVKSETEYWVVLNQFLAKLKDIHVGIQIKNDIGESLPIQFSYVDGKTVANYIARTDLPKTECPIQVGDELLRIGGKTPSEYRNELSKSQDMGNAESNLQALTLSFSRGSLARGQLLSRNNSTHVNITYYSQTQNQEASCSVKIIKDEEKEKTLQRPEPSASVSFSARPFLEKLAPQVQESEADEGYKVGGPIPTTKFELPADFKAIAPPEMFSMEFIINPLLAGTFAHNGKRVGYLRVSSFAPFYTVDPLSNFIMALRYYISILNETTDYLIIDQTYNSGGYLALADVFIGAFVENYDYEKHINFRYKTNDSVIAHYYQAYNTYLAEDTSADDVTFFGDKLFEDYKKLIADEKLADGLSPAISYLPISRKAELDLNKKYYPYISAMFKSKLAQQARARMIQGLPPGLDPRMSFASYLKVDVTKRQVYTKSVYMLINEMNFSAADLVPATLKDYDRVTLIGTNTGGAGGNVTPFFSPDEQLQYLVTITSSLMVRKDGSHIENVGVKPDIEFKETIEDYRDGFKTYLSRVLAEINQ
ncbi:MAG: hypothetical protein JNM93_01310 [Bacteriovoracaceae bacterium]|nr:hypothetical protein [Bacteriovoracaceae bacterium]